MAEGERELGATDDVRALVAGDPEALGDTAAHLGALAAAFGRTAAGLARTDVGGWSGEAADAFRRRFGGAPGRWAGAAEAFERAATAWGEYTRVVGWAQGRAAEAAALYLSGVAAAGRAAPDGAAPAPSTDPRAAIVDRARSLLAEARRQRDRAGDEAARVIAAAAAIAPDPPSGWDRIGAEAVDGIGALATEGAHLAGGLVEGTVTLVEAAGALNPADPRNVARPAAYFETVSTAAAGLATDALHPVRAVGAFVGRGWESDPAAAAGRAIPQIAAAVVAGGAGRSVLGGEQVAAVPLGFAGPAEFARFGVRLHEGLARAGFPGTRAVLQGSAATGRSFRTGNDFDVGRTSDYDVALGGPELFDAARSAGINPRSAGTRTGPLRPGELEGLGLADVRRELSEMMDRRVEFMIYRDIADAVARSPSVGVPGP